VLTSAGAVQVSSATCCQYGGAVAIKLLSSQACTEQTSREGLVKDLRVWQALGPSARTMTVVDALFEWNAPHTDEHLIGLVFALYKRGSLHDCANAIRMAVPGGAVDVPTALHVMMDVVCGLRHMHSRGVVHCDVKEGNVLVGDDSRCIVSDYGLSCTYGAQCHVGCTFEYAAPEVCSLPALPLSAA
jgi:serine/threonine protein kinase